MIALLLWAMLTALATAQAPQKAMLMPQVGNTDDIEGLALSADGRIDRIENRVITLLLECGGFDPTELAMLKAELKIVGGDAAGAVLEGAIVSTLAGGQSN